MNVYADMPAFDCTHIIIKKTNTKYNEKVILFVTHPLQ